MSGEVATTSGVTEWTPDLGGLPDGWEIVEIRLHAAVTSWRHEPSEAEVTLRYDPFGRDYHEVRLRVLPQTPPVNEWLYPFLESMKKVPWPTYADIASWPPPRW